MLIAEDVGSIALSFEDALADAGYEVAGTFATAASGLEWLSRNTPQVGLLDVVLSDGTSIELARALRARNVPVVFITGLKDREGLPADLQDCLWLEKPLPYDVLIGAIRDATRIGE